ncbi:MAG: DUF5942 domain-containing protein [Acidobacteriota bacterium]
MNPYFWNGLQHALAGLACAWGFFALTRQPRFAPLASASPTAEPASKAASEAELPLRWVLFWCSLLMGASAWFFFPSHIDRPGTWTDWLWQLTHYPIPDWDILWLGLPWHRWFLTHSALLPTALIVLTFEHPAWRAVGYGLAVGMASHLAWDAITQSPSTPIVFLPDTLLIRSDAARAWLLGHACAAFGLAVLAERRYPIAG